MVEDKLPDKPQQSGDDSNFGWKRAAEFLKNILKLERSVDSLKTENEALRKQIDELQRIVDDHNGQLKVILSTLKNSLSDQVKSTAEHAAIDAVVRLIGGSGTGDRPAGPDKD